MKAIVESFEGSGISITQAKISLQATGLVTQFLKIKGKYKCVIKLTEMMESAKCLIKKRCMQSENLISENAIAALTITFKKCKTMIVLK